MELYESWGKLLLHLTGRIDFQKFSNLERYPAYQSPSEFDMGNIIANIRNVKETDIINILSKKDAGECLEWVGRFSNDGKPIINKFYNVCGEKQYFYWVLRKIYYEPEKEYKKRRVEAKRKQYLKGKISDYELGMVAEREHKRKTRRTIELKKHYLFYPIKKRSERIMDVTKLLFTYIQARDNQVYSMKFKLKNTCEMGSTCVNPYHKRASK